MFVLHSSIAKFFIVQMQQLGQKGFRKALVANQQKDQTHPSSSRMFLFRRRHLPPPWCRRHFFYFITNFQDVTSTFRMHLLHSSIVDLSIVQVQHLPTYWSQQNETQIK
jgi:hypothetical protein